MKRKDIYSGPRRSFSIPELAGRHGIGRSTIYNEIAAHRLEVTKIGMRTVVTEEQETAWLKRLASSEAA